MLVSRHDIAQSFGVGRQIFDYGAYNPGEIEDVKSLLCFRRQYYGDGVVAIDGGANIGVFTLEWAKLMRGWGRVIAIEAQERLFYALAGNVALQNCFNARAVWAALSNELGELSIPEPDYTQDGSFGSFSLVAGEFIGQQIDYSKPTSVVKQITIDSLGLERVDLLKLDLEGMEGPALAGGLETIQRCKPILFIETIKTGDISFGEGYRTFKVGMNTIGIHESDKTQENMVVDTLR